ncbi:MHYT domain-containing protein [Microbulbifer litoralis]|uniref:MHYT domain-containing protein n=1 Tax=Microbulbifer litoralis TaxID=2933965 RepID=UPI0020297FCB|nr:MHYT domain-containing protein [Microbulbifer sp. GX H0434]
MMFANHDLLLVGLSYAVSVLGSYTALELATAIPAAASRREKYSAILRAAAVMGGGAVWSMHFIAMLAFDMDIAVSYDILVTLLSALISIGACTMGFMIAGIGRYQLINLLPAGCIMGCGVAGMHYAGMAAMLMPMEIDYNLNTLLISVIIAAVASCTALWMAFCMRGYWQKLVSALAMAVAICGMHYTGMAAASYRPSGTTPTDSGLGAVSGDYLGLATFTIATLLLARVLLKTVSARRESGSVISS